MKKTFFIRCFSHGFLPTHLFIQRSLPVTFARPELIRINGPVMEEIP